MSHSSVDAAAVCKFESFSALLAEENKGTLLDVAREVLRRENPDSWRACGQSYDSVYSGRWRFTLASA